MAKKAARWDDTLYVTAYQYAKQGLSDVQIAQALAVGTATFTRWKRDKPALKNALERGRSESAESPAETLTDFVYGRLPPEAQRIWDKLHEMDECSAPVAQIESMLAQQGTIMRQRLFLHALVYCHWNKAEACRQVNVPRPTVDAWIENDPDFASLMVQLHQSLKDFYESALVRGVARGEPSLIALANRTFNADRGYRETTKTEHQHAHVHAFSGAPRYTLNDLDLPPQVLREIVAAIERKEADLVATDNKRSLSDDNKRSPRPVPLLPNPESSAE